jgi:hypothetical protein
MYLFQDNEEAENDNFYMNNYMEESIFDQLGDSQDYGLSLRDNDRPPVTQGPNPFNETEDSQPTLNYGFGNFATKQPAGVMTALEKDLRIIPEQDESIVNMSPKTCNSNSNFMGLQMEQKYNTTMGFKSETRKHVPQKALETKLNELLRISNSMNALTSLPRQENPHSVQKIIVESPKERQIEFKPFKEQDQHPVPNQVVRHEPKDSRIQPEPPKNPPVINFSKPMTFNQLKETSAIKAEPPQTFKEKPIKAVHSPVNLAKELPKIPTFNVPTLNLPPLPILKSKQNSSSSTPKANSVQLNIAPPSNKKLNVELPKITLPPKIAIPNINSAKPVFAPIKPFTNKPPTTTPITTESSNAPSLKPSELEFVAKKLMPPEHTLTKNPLVKPPEIKFASFATEKPIPNLNTPKPSSINSLSIQPKTIGIQLPHRSFSSKPPQGPSSKGRVNDRQRIVELHQRMLKMKEREKRLKLSVFCMNSKAVFLKERIDKLNNSINLTLG